MGKEIAFFGIFKQWQKDQYLVVITGTLKKLGTSILYFFYISRESDATGDS